ncbi:hypothetical protein ACFE04_025795 [Oxalis oulophora]
MNQLLIAIFSSFFAFAIFIYYTFYNIRKLNKNAPPQAGGSWPVIGHLHLLGGPEPAHKVLGKLADKHGPIFTINLGVHPALVVSTWEVAKECLTRNDQVFADRPKTLAMDVLGYNFSMQGFSPYGHVLATHSQDHHCRAPLPSSPSDAKQCQRLSCAIINQTLVSIMR